MKKKDWTYIYAYKYIYICKFGNNNELILYNTDAKYYRESYPITMNDCSPTRSQVLRFSLLHSTHFAFRNCSTLSDCLETNIMHSLCIVSCAQFSSNAFSSNAFSSKAFSPNPFCPILHIRLD